MKLTQYNDWIDNFSYLIYFNKELITRLWT